MLNDRRMLLAKKISYKGIGRVRIGAVLVSGKGIVNVGFNNTLKTHPIISKNCHKKLHAEVDCIIGIHRRCLRNGVMYLYRERLDGKIGMCRPCSSCEAILKSAGIKKVYYTNPNIAGYVGEMKL